MLDTPGKLLKKAREDKGKLLEDFSRLLKIRYDYLKAIEDEDYQLIPGEVFIKGYIRIYANALGIDSDHILDLYKKQTTAVQLIDQPPPKKKTFFTYKFIVITASVALIVLLSTLFAIHEYKESDINPLRKFFSKESLNASKKVKMAKKPLTASREEQPMFSLKIIATEDTWVSVSIDKGNPEQQLLRTGEIIRLTASKGFSIKIGNAGGTKLIFNGKDIGDIGTHGKVVRVILPKDTS